MAFIRLDLGKCGKTTCICEKGYEAGRCKFLQSQRYGEVWKCRLFDQELRDETGEYSGPGKLQRLKECKKLQIK